MKNDMVPPSSGSSGQTSAQSGADGRDAAATEEILTIDLKNRYLALLLAWLIPGLGHLYQGRIAKAVLFGVPIILLLILGIRAGTYYPTLPNGERGTARWASCVYCDFPSDAGRGIQKLAAGRLYFIPQAACGIVAIPACLQTSRFKSGKPLLFNGAFAPPTRANLGTVYTSSAVNPQLRNPTFDDLVLTLGGWFDLGT
ncbi:MAG: hypothetical protein J6S75_08905, partial [Thermoguttaceae bacterium]|nr:hypothetical protein [Thermoguttaceae bacterium]